MNCYECASCGKAVSAEDGICPYCGNECDESSLEQEDMEERKNFHLKCSKCDAQQQSVSTYCELCGKELEYSSTERLLLSKVVLLEEEISRIKEKLPNTAVVSQSFWKRAFVIYGHVVVASLVIFLPIYLIILLLNS